MKIVEAAVLLEGAVVDMANRGRPLRAGVPAVQVCLSPAESVVGWTVYRHSTNAGGGSPTSGWFGW